VNPVWIFNFIYLDAALATTALALLTLLCRNMVRITGTENFIATHIE
jgi:hypothetical protein